MAGNPLSPQSILQAMADALPTHEKDDTTSDMSSSAEAIALFTHACMVNLGFRLVGFNEDHKMESECAELAPRLPPRWNASVSSYSFLYAHTQSSMQFVTKTDRLGSKIEIRGLAVGHEQINRLELVARDYVSSSALPLRITLRPDTGAEDRSDLPEKMQKVFISPERVSDLANLLKIQIIQRLVPSLQKEGYEDTPDDRAVREDADRRGREGPSRQPQPQVPAPGLPQPARPYPFDDPLADPPRRPVPPGDFPPPDFEDEFEMNRPRPPRALGTPGDGRSPFGIGHDDLHPPGLGPHDPLRGSFGPGGLWRPGGMGGGMHPTFDDPLFQGPRGGGQRDMYDPQAPPGARWDPVGPGLGGPRFGGGGGGGSWGGGNPFGGGDII